MYFLYFDPTIGAMIVQAIVAAFAGFILFSKNLLLKIKLFLGITKLSEDEIFDEINVKEPLDEKNKPIDR